MFVTATANSKTNSPYARVSAVEVGERKTKSGILKYFNPGKCSEESMPHLRPQSKVMEEVDIKDVVPVLTVEALSDFCTNQNYAASLNLASALQRNPHGSQSTGIITLEKIYEVVSSINVHVKSIDDRFKTFELHQRSEEADSTYNGYFTNNLPLKELEEVNEFDEYITNEETHKAFITFLSGIGGRNAKDNIQRCLKTCFTNGVAMKCSWLGQRGNFRVCGLSSILALKSVVKKLYDITDKDFETIGSEWFRLAKVRMKSRENVS